MVSSIRPLFWIVATIVQFRNYGFSKELVPGNKSKLAVWRNENLSRDLKYR